MDTPHTPAARSAPLGAAGLDDEQVEATAALFKALADPTRVRIVNVLATADAPVCACDLEGPTGLSQPTVSHHMKRLVSAGLVTAERHGTWTYYGLDPRACRKLAEVSAVTRPAETPAPA